MFFFRVKLFLYSSLTIPVFKRLDKTLRWVKMIHNEFKLLVVLKDFYFFLKITFTKTMKSHKMNLIQFKKHVKQTKYFNGYYTTRLEKTDWKSFAYLTVKLSHHFGSKWQSVWSISVTNCRLFQKNIGSRAKRRIWSPANIWVEPFGENSSNL